MSKTNIAGRGHKAPRSRMRDLPRAARQGWDPRHNALIEEEEGDSDGDLALDLEEEGEDEDAEAGEPGR